MESLQKGENFLKILSKLLVKCSNPLVKFYQDLDYIFEEIFEKFVEISGKFS